MNRSKLYGVINMGKKQLDMDDDSYRAMIKRISGHESLRSCSFDHLNKIIDEMVKKGFKLQARKQDQGKSKRVNPVRYNKTGFADIRDKVLALWIEMHKQGIVRDSSDIALATYCKKQSGSDHWHWASIDEATNIIEGLKQWQSRVLLKRLLDELKKRDIVIHKFELDSVAEIQREKALSNYTSAENWRVIHALGEYYKIEGYYDKE